MSDEERPREHGENPTQERMDQEGFEGRPADVDWEGGGGDAGGDEEELERTPHQGEEGQAGDVA